MDIKLAHASPGTMCASVMASGSHVISRLHSCVDSMMPPCGSMILSGFLVGLTLMTGAPGTAKVPVAPASDINVVWYFYSWCIICAGVNHFLVWFI